MSKDVLEKVKRLFLEGERCERCCPCPHRDKCPLEPLYQEIKQELLGDDVLHPVNECIGCDGGEDGKCDKR